MIATILAAALTASSQASASEWWIGGADASLSQFVVVAHGCGDDSARIRPIPNRSGNMVIVTDASGATHSIRCAMDWWLKHPELQLTPLVQPAPGALVRQGGPQFQSVGEQRSLFDTLFRSLGRSLDGAERALGSLPAPSTLEQWTAAKPTVFRASDLCGAMGMLFKSAADRAREMPEGDERKAFNIEIMREIVLFAPVEQRQLALIREVLAKRPKTAGAQSAGGPGDPVPVTPMDYPPAALRLHHEGRVAYRLSYGMEGRVTHCIVTASSGYADLDEATCRLMSRRSRFAAGAAGTRDGSVSWRIPPTSPPGPAEPTLGTMPSQSDAPEAASAYQLGKAPAAAALGNANPR